MPAHQDPESLQQEGKPKSDQDQDLPLLLQDVADLHQYVAISQWGDSIAGHSSPGVNRARPSEDAQQDRGAGEEIDEAEGEEKGFEVRSVKVRRGEETETFGGLEESD